MIESDTVAGSDHQLLGTNPAMRRAWLAHNTGQDLVAVADTAVSRTNQALQNCSSASIGSIAGTPNMAATRSVTSALARPPSVPAAAM